MKKDKNRYRIIYLYILLITNISYAQSSNQLDASQLDNSQQPIIYREYGVKPLPLENAIDPEEYYLGPGDRLRILWSVENIDNFVTIGPTGNLIIPELGPINVLGKTLADIDREIALDAITLKDKAAFKIGLNMGVSNYSLSFTNSNDAFKYISKYSEKFFLFQAINSEFEYKADAITIKF